jgi:hypothetical protein
MIGALSAHAALAGDGFIRTSESSASEAPGADGVARRTLLNTTFHFDTLVLPSVAAPVAVLVEQRIESWSIAGMEGGDSILETQAWENGTGRYDRRRWVIRDHADAAARWGDFYRTTRHGCCGGEDVHRAFDFETGEFLFSYTTDPVVVSVPNAATKRYVSWLSALAAADFEHVDRQGAVGELTMWSDAGVVDRLVFESDDPELTWSPEVRLVDERERNGVTRLSLWSSEGASGSAAVSGFVARLSFGDGRDFEIPVAMDRFDEARANLTEGVRVVRVPLFDDRERLATRFGVVRLQEGRSAGNGWRLLLDGKLLKSGRYERVHAEPAHSQAASVHSTEDADLVVISLDSGGCVCAIALLFLQIGPGGIVRMADVDACASDVEAVRLDGRALVVETGSITCEERSDEEAPRRGMLYRFENGRVAESPREE